MNIVESGVKHHVIPPFYDDWVVDLARKAKRQDFLAASNPK
jgi:hypothetical protein